jgi:hypothetical protein
MKYVITFILISSFFAAGLIFIVSCGKGGSGATPAPSNPCSGVTIIVDGSFTNPSAPAATDGSISASAPGSTGFTFNINGGAFQASGNFTNLAAGTYTVNAKNGNNCSGSKTFTLTAPNLCTGVAITVSNITTLNTPCQSPNNGSITSTGAGGTAPFTYSLDGGAFQSSNLFSNLNSGNYSVTAKDANGCAGSANVTINSIAEGPLYSAVKTLIQLNCAIPGCHADVQQPLFLNQCAIISNSVLIKARAVDGNPSPMPTTGLLSASERQKITDWINAGGQFNN